MNVAQHVFSRRGFCAAGAAGAVLGFNRLATAADADASAMITQIAKLKLNLDKEEEGLQVLKDLCAAVEKNEPDVLAYVCSRSAKKPEEIVFFEVYKDKAALKAHGRTPHLAKLVGKLGTVFNPPLEVTRLDRVGGYTRDCPGASPASG